MVEKYGEGDTSIHKCRTCDHEQEIRSAGVHVSEGGSISDNEDEFYCPNCDSIESEQQASNNSGNYYCTANIKSSEIDN